MRRLMIVPAAGLGSRLKSPVPKILFPVAGRPMIRYLFDLYGSVVDRLIFVLHPSFSEPVQRYCAELDLPVDYDIQQAPTGMLDAILVAHDRAHRYQPDEIWITWCDQIAVHPETVRRVADTAQQERDAALVMPTIVRAGPYIHVVRDSRGRITDILHRREGDALPPTGESDLGLFCLSPNAYFEQLTCFARKAADGHSTKERNFLPFIPWLAKRARVVTFPAQNAIESVGVNDAADLGRIEQYLSNAQQETLNNYSGIQ